MSDSSNVIIIISIIVAVLAFLALVVFLVCTLIFVIKTLKRTEDLIEHSNGIAADVERKLHAFDPLFNQINELGKLMDQKTESIKRVTERVSESKSEREEHRVETVAGIVELCEWALIGIGLTSRFFKKRK